MKKKKIARKMMRILATKTKEWVEGAMVATIALVVVCAIGGGTYALGYFGSKIWFEGTVDQYPVLSKIFVSGVDVNEALGIATILCVVLIMGAVMLIDKIRRAIRNAYFEATNGQD